MNIVRLLGSTRVLSTAVGIGLFIIGAQYALTPHHLILSCDPRWAPELQSTLKKKVQRLSIRTIGASRLRDDLKEDYPCVKEVTFEYKSSLDATVTLTSWRPLVIIRSSMPGNKEYTVCEKETVLDARNFAPAALQGLPTIIVEGGDFEAKRRSPDLIDTARHMNTLLFDRYDIVWHSKTNITLHDKERPVTITSDIMSVHDQDRYAYVQKIFDTERRYKKGMKADIRLKDSLVCAPLTKK